MTLLMFLAEALSDGPWSELTVGGILAIGIIAVWRVNTRLASKNEQLQDDATKKAEDRAEKARQETQELLGVLNANSQAMEKLTTTQNNLVTLLERVLHERRG